MNNMINMKNWSQGIFLGFLIVIALFSSSCKKSEVAAALEVSSLDIKAQADGERTEVTITSNDAWTAAINDAVPWIEIGRTAGGAGATQLQLKFSGNGTGASRYGVVTIKSGNGQARRIKITQIGNLYPTYNLSPKAPDATGMSSTAVQLAAKMHLGINFGNTMESPVEGEWQNSKLTESYVKFVKQMGFNTVRIPCNWNWSHLSDPDKVEIDRAWLNRVKEVVGWCVANDMYVMLNTHGDNGWLENNVNAAKQEEINARLKALWEQIATTMRDFDEHLIFAGTNEPAVENAEQMAILNSYHETFIKAVRSTGGRNSYRVLVVQGPSTDPTKTFTLMNTMPKDEIPNKLMVEVHDYTPSTFTILTDGDVSWGKMAYYWGKGNHSTIEPERNATYGEEDVIDTEFKNIKQKFVDNGVPVMLGEYAAWRRNAINNPNYLPKDLAMHNKSVNDWTYYLTKQAKANGILPFYWEIGFMLDRANNVVKDQAMLDALIAGSK
ncbi:endoglucanase [Pedobacter sp. W3I1]|uniref:cellulase family glycosylhydrolase n=1 Tax=Pedobacter sp. W3I1 TaxID=3042291 RepID=UPI002782E088|nr:cellulase family glycosylhydrolase [Pedobacter sp. W3I1]MDQ0640989.1 endoglucanase [Pedobacter sp. W3I1]